MLAEIALEAETGRYGENLMEAMSPGADPADYTSGFVYVAHGPRTNWAERAVADAEEAYRKDLGENEKMPAGLSWWVTKETYTPVPEGVEVEVQYEQAAYAGQQAPTDATP